VITVEESKSLTTDLDVVEECSWTEAIFLPTSSPTTSGWWWNLKTSDPAHRQENQHHPGFDSRLEKSPAGQPLLIIAEDVDGEALATLVENARVLECVRASLWRSPQSHAARHRRSDWWLISEEVGLTLPMPSPSDRQEYFLQIHGEQNAIIAE